MCNLNNKLLTNGLKEKITIWIRKQFEIKIKTTHQNSQNAAKAVPRGKFIAINAYTKKERISNQQTNFIP